MKRLVMRASHVVVVASNVPHYEMVAQVSSTQGMNGLESHSRRPKNSPSIKTDTAEVALILELRSLRNLGAKRIQGELKRLHSIEYIPLTYPINILCYR